MAQASITNVISTRLYPGTLSTAPTLPAVTMALTGHEHENHLTGQTGIAHAIIQFDAYNLDPLDSRKDAGIVEQIRLVLLDPDIVHTTVQGVWIEAVALISGPIELPSPPRDASQQNRFLTMCNYRVSYAEGVPT
jgi:hypothetical protein